MYPPPTIPMPISVIPPPVPELKFATGCKTCILGVDSAQDAIANEPLMIEKQADYERDGKADNG
ncbi:MAG: hypothetical protein KKI16_00490, partial [Alphaproteobacteria bacterium]|nr:hypothetical protein [Alphaproteobacteria bacterium]